ncbi:MAG: class I SAM-dependent methyltransferase [Lysinibacillus sp.]
MSFYKTLTPYYDDIFPANEKTVAFLASHFQEGVSVLDVGAGTGNMAIALAQQGFRVTAMEPEEGMAKQIQLKAQAQQLPITVTTNTMQQIGALEGTYQGIYCIGNTLVHLNDLEEIRTFFQQTFEKLQSEGTFIFQIVNYEKKDFAFPVMEKEGFTFERQYERDGDHILFTTTLSTKEGAQTNTIPLYPATFTQLCPLLEACGFETIEAYGNFVSKAYDSDAPALIMVAKKGR